MRSLLTLGNTSILNLVTAGHLGKTSYCNRIRFSNLLPPPAAAAAVCLQFPSSLLIRILLLLLLQCFFPIGALPGTRSGELTPSPTCDFEDITVRKYTKGNQRVCGKASISDTCKKTRWFPIRSQIKARRRDEMKHWSTSLTSLWCEMLLCLIKQNISLRFNSFQFSTIFPPHLQLFVWNTQTKRRLVPLWVLFRAHPFTHSGMIFNTTPSAFCWSLSTVYCVLAAACQGQTRCYLKHEDKLRVTETLSAVWKDSFETAHVLISSQQQGCWVSAL